MIRILAEHRLEESFKDNSKIDVIKIDVEGAEMLTLLGMDNIIRANKNLKVFIEFTPARIIRMGFSPEEFLNKLKDYRFKIFTIDEEKRILDSINNNFEDMCKITHINLFCVK
jgi:hypothetical protein